MTSTGDQRHSSRLSSHLNIRIEPFPTCSVHLNLSLRPLLWWEKSKKFRNGANNNARSMCLAAPLPLPSPELGGLFARSGLGFLGFWGLGFWFLRGWCLGSKRRSPCRHAGSRRTRVSSNRVCFRLVFAHIPTHPRTKKKTSKKRKRQITRKRKKKRQTAQNKKKEKNKRKKEKRPQRCKHNTSNDPFSRCKSVQ